MADEVVPVPDAVRALPSPREIGAALKAELVARVTRERAVRGDVHQEEDVYALVRALAGARDLLHEYAYEFAGAEGSATQMLEEELVAAVGEQDGIPTSGLKVPDLNGTDIHFDLATSNTYDIDQRAVLTAVIWTAIDRMRDGEPAQEQDESDRAYEDRYWKWFAHVVERVLDVVFNLGTYSMQVSKVRAYMTALAGEGDDAMAAVLRGAITKTQRYRGVKVERKQRKKP